MSVQIQVLFNFTVFNYSDSTSVQIFQFKALILIFPQTADLFTHWKQLHYVTLTLFGNNS